MFFRRPAARTRQRAGASPIGPGEAARIFDAVTAEDDHPLARLTRQRGLLAVRFEETKETFSSFILDFDESAGRMVLDEFAPGGLPDDLLDRRASFEARARLDGQTLTFSGRVTGTGTDGVRRYHRVPIPASLSLEHRRAYRRIPLPMTSRVGVRLQHRDAGEAATTSHGTLRDLSAGGFAATIGLAPGSAPPARGEKIDRCVIESPAGHRLLTPVHVCHAERLKSADHYRLGVQFASRPRPDIVARLLHETDCVSAS